MKVNKVTIKGIYQIQSGWYSLKKSPLKGNGQRTHKPQTFLFVLRLVLSLNLLQGELQTEYTSLGPVHTNAFSKVIW